MTIYTSVDKISVDEKVLAKKKVLFLADDLHKTKTVIDYIAQIKNLSVHNLKVVNPIKIRNTKEIKKINVEDFDVILVHYSIYISSYYFLSKAWQQRIKKFKKIKILIIQDEYREVFLTHYQIKNLGFSVIISSLSQINLPKVYPEKKFRGVTFVSALPGYISDWMKRIKTIPLKDKKSPFIFGRGRPHPFALGSGKFIKDKIYFDYKKKFPKDISLDISNKQEDRLEGHLWTKSLKNARFLIASEGGSSMFDFDGTVARIESSLAYINTKNLTDKQIYNKFFKKFDNNIVHKTITPRIFEAICSRTGLLLLEGNYRDIIKPDIHYIEIKNNFSNLKDVIKKIRDDQFVEKLINRAYADVAKSHSLSFKFFVSKLDILIGKE